LRKPDLETVGLMPPIQLELSPSRKSGNIFSKKRERDILSAPKARPFGPPTYRRLSANMGNYPVPEYLNLPANIRPVKKIVPFIGGSVISELYGIRGQINEVFHNRRNLNFMIPSQVGQFRESVGALVFNPMMR